ncbi:MAG: hypothetical protein JWN44_5781 [Myxococcales bacterium]|nr:hypothetical protein [Myxococcales bacterium]
MVHRHALSLEQNVQPSIAEAMPLGGETAQSRNQFRRWQPFRFVPMRCPRYAKHSARASLAHAECDGYDKNAADFPKHRTYTQYLLLAGELASMAFMRGPYYDAAQRDGERSKVGQADEEPRARKAPGVRRRWPTWASLSVAR